MDLNQKESLDKDFQKKKCWRWKDFRIKKAAAMCLVLVLTLSPCSSFFCGSILTQAAQFSIDFVCDEDMIEDVKFDFFGSYTKVDIYYWIKSDRTPLLCVQKNAQLTDGLSAQEDPEEFGADIHFNKSQYELVSIVLQCCGMRHGETEMLEPGAYLAGQAAVWGILSRSWLGTEQLRQEMENLHTHVVDWNGWTAAEIIAQSEAMTEVICQAIEDYYGDSSKYIPAFASKYENNAPVWQAQWIEDGSCQVVFQLEDRAEAVKDFQFQLPVGWTCLWEDDQVIFQCDDPQTGMISVTGRAPEGSVLGGAMPIGLIYVVKSDRYHSLQHLASGVELTIPWSCYFTIYVPENTGSWQLPEAQLYRHQEDFTALYGICLEKTDGDTGEFLEGVKFQPLEYFDDRQLDGTVLDREQLESWDGWKACCEEEMTDQEGRLTHLDWKQYHYEKTYCGGHPDPVIDYDGKTTAVRQQLETEAWEAWEAAVASCEALCDYHTLDGSGAALLEADRDLAYEQFIHLIYGYTFEETKPLEGYLPHGESPKDQEIRKIFCVSLQAGGEEAKARKLRRSKNKVAWVTASAAATQSDASHIKGQEKEEAVLKQERLQNKQTGQKAENKVGSRASSSEATRKLTRKSAKAASASDGIKTVKRTRMVWLTSLVEPLAQEVLEDVEGMITVCLQVKNHKPEEPEETTPEETTPEETTPEETTPEETTPEETTPEETTPEETTPEETTPEETTPEETTPEETTPEETTPEETTPEETTPEETTPEETTPEETTPEETTPEETTPEETTPEETLPEETTPEETTPEETTPEETMPEETLPEETMPEETSPEETTPEESTPEETLPEKSSSEGSLPEETTPKETPSEESRPEETTPPAVTGGNGGGRGGKPPVVPVVPETVGILSLPEIPSIPSLRVGWIDAKYAIEPLSGIDDEDIPGSGRRKKQNITEGLPNTGDSRMSGILLLAVFIGSGLLLLWGIRKRMAEGRKEA